ncbi:MAG: hypothetical protein ACTSUF_10220 [Candidatus Heimdallarchaeaceae archaeon]
MNKMVEFCVEDKFKIMYEEDWDYLHLYQWMNGKWIEIDRQHVTEIMREWKARAEVEGLILYDSTINK